MDDIFPIIDAALKRKGLSDAAASKLAVGHPSLLKNLRLPAKGEKRYNLPSLMKLAQVLDLEFYFGPRRDTGHVEQIVLDEREYAHVPVHSASLAAGHGAENGDAEVIDHLAFRRDWLARIGVSASQAVLARAGGDSMVPTIQPGDLMLIDRAQHALQVRARRPGDTRPAPIYALLDDGLARVKRIERPEPGLVMLLSDNPAFGPEVVAGAAIERLDIIGKVMWWGHTNRD